MIRIIKVNYSVGQPEKVAVIVSETNNKSIHEALNKVVGVIDKYASIEYLEQYAVPAVQLDGHEIKAIWHLDDMIDNMK